MTNARVEESHPRRRKHKPIVTMSDVAKEAGVSPKTVSNVVNDYVHIRPETRAKVQDAIDKLGYQMNLPAQSLRRGTTGTIGLAVPDLENPYFATTVQEIMEEAERRGLKVIVELTGGAPDKEVGVLSNPLRSMTDGLILALTGLRQGQDEVRLDVDFPLVVLGDQPFGPLVTQVTMSNVDGARAATDFLLDRGARRVVFLGWHPDRTATSELRFQGYQEALEARGIAVDEELILEEADWTRHRGAATLERAIADGVKFDAVFGLNDILAIGALHTLNTRRISVPEEVQVIGFDCLDESLYTSPSLTTVDPSVVQIARDAVKILVDRIDGITPQNVHPRIFEPFTIRERGTTRPRF